MAPLPKSALLIQLATARPRPIKARPLDWRVQSKDWPHAGRPAHELRYSIYRDLWERGFFLSAAGKFGGDFLVYPGEFVLGPVVTFFFTIPPRSAFPAFFISFSQLLRNRKHLGTQALLESSLVNEQRKEELSQKTYRIKSKSFFVVLCTLLYLIIHIHCRFFTSEPLGKPFHILAIVNNAAMNIGACFSS